MAQSGNCTALLQYKAGGTAVDALMVVVSVIMGILAVLLLVRGLLGRLSGAAAITPTVRYFLWGVFALFLTLMSYMFYKVKDSGEVLRPQLILLWMILTEILRKKLDGVSTINDYPLQGVNKQSTWDAVGQIVSLAWLGYLIYRYAVKWVLVALWAIGIVKVAQRLAAAVVAKRSFALGKNPHLIAGYMRQLSTKEEQQHETAATGEEAAEEQQQHETAALTGEEAAEEQQQHETAATGEEAAEGQQQHALWAFSIVKVAQRLAAAVVAKFSFTLGKNLHLIAGYMRLLSTREEQQHGTAALTGEEAAEEQQQHETAALTGEEAAEEQQQHETAATGGEAVMMACEYAIMGEDKVERKEGPRGCSLKLSDPNEREKMVTVGDVWRLAASGDTNLFSFKWLNLKDLCLSFALYKLLRRRFEERKCAEAGSRQSLDFLLRGLLAIGDDRDISPHDKGERVFRVIEYALSFLSDYYYSSIPLMLSNLWFFLLYCVLVFVIPVFCLIVIFVSIVIGRDGLIWCVFDRIINKNVTVPILYDPTVTLFLIATLFFVELVEVTVYVISSWVMVSLLCTYVKKPSWRRSAIVLSALTMLWKANSFLNHSELEFNQHSLLEPRACFLKEQSKLLKIVLHRRYLCVPSTPVPKEVKAAIVKYLVDNGEVLRQNWVAENGLLLEAFKRDGAAETIIAWHIATCLYEMKHPSPPPSQQSDDHDMKANRRIAETLSKYCAYLVALEPELLPDDKAGTKTAYKDAVKKIQDAILEERDRKVDDFERVTSMRNVKGTAAERGAELGHQLVGDERLEEWRVWKELAELWTEIVVYIAPSKDVKSHAAALAQGGEFITHIWALLTLGGIFRWDGADESPV